MKNFIERYKETQSAWDIFVLFENSLIKLIEENDLILFFVKGGSVYGTSEDGRMAFATMKDKKEKSKFKNEIRILAINLSKSIDGYKSEATLSKKDLKGIKIIDREEAVEGDDLACGAQAGQPVRCFDVDRGAVEARGLHL